MLIECVERALTSGPSGWESTSGSEHAAIAPPTVPSDATGPLRPPRPGESEPAAGEPAPLGDP
jgi:hypothetical protein